MIRVNDQEIKLNDLETPKSLTLKIAKLLSTLPKYLYFEKPLDIIPGQSIRVEDMLKTITNEAEAGTGFESLIEKLRPKLGSLDIKTDVLFLWLVKNKSLASGIKSNSFLLDSVADSLVSENYVDDKSVILSFYKHGKRNYEETLKHEIENQAQEKEETIDVFKDIEEGIPSTDLHVEKITYKLYMQKQDITLGEVFNAIRTDKIIPFAYYNNYYKILKNFIPSESWNSDEKNCIILKVNNKVEMQYNLDEYVDVFIRNKDSIIELEIYVKTERGFVSSQVFQNRIFTCISDLNLKIESKIESEAIAVFYFPQSLLDTHVFSDLIMNNFDLANIIASDESKKATKKTPDNPFPWLYVHFDHPSTEHVAAHLIQKIVNRSDPEMVSQDIDIFPHNAKYIRVRAKGRNVRALDTFKEILSKIFEVYYRQYDSIVKFYRQFIPNFGNFAKIEVELKKKQVKLVAPDLFMQNYSRNCTLNRMPVLEAEVPENTNVEEGGKAVFPRDAGFLPAIPSDGVNQQTYVCINPDYPYLGLQKNNLSNSDKYPFTPCCFKTPQDKPGSLLRHYYYGEELETAEKKQQDLIMTEKVVAPGKFGVLSSFLSNFFQSSLQYTKYKMIRYGIENNTNSFISAVAQALSYNENPSSIRKSLVEYAILAKQCMFNDSLENIVKLIKDETVYFDPSLFTQLLEVYFDCSIYVFNPEGMSIPKYTEGYSRYVPKARSVLIYEHMGSESDRLTHPHCELVCRWSTDDSSNVKLYFDSEKDNVATLSERLLSRLTETWVLNTKIVPINIPPPFLTLLSAQSIDNYGKTRTLLINSKEYGKFTLLTTPLQPLLLPVNTTLYKAELQAAISFFQTFGRINHQLVSNGIVRQVSGSLFNIRASIKVNSAEPVKNLPTIEDASYENSVSELEIYNTNKKLARYMSEYALWMFSTFVNTNDISEFTDKAIVKFSKKKMIIIPDYKYENVNKVFSLNSNFIKDGKLVVNSEEMLKRILYYIKLYSIQHTETLKEYSNRNMITEYYVDITDFNTHENQVILQGEDSIYKWKQELTSKTTMTDSIIIGRSLPYFFKNPLVNNTLYIAQNTSDLNHGIEIALSWIKYGINIGSGHNKNEEKDDLQYSFVLYSYRNSSNITVHNFQGTIEPDDTIRIIGYKIDENYYYTVLLET